MGSLLLVTDIGLRRDKSPDRRIFHSSRPGNRRKQPRPARRPRSRPSRRRARTLWSTPPCLGPPAGTAEPFVRRGLRNRERYLRRSSSELPEELQPERLV